MAGPPAGSLRGTADIIDPMAAGGGIFFQTAAARLRLPRRRPARLPLEPVDRGEGGETGSRLEQGLLLALRHLYFFRFSNAAVHACARLCASVIWAGVMCWTSLSLAAADSSSVAARVIHL